MFKSRKTNLETLGLCAIAGMRTNVATSVAHNYLSLHPNPALKRSTLRYVQSPVFALVNKLLIPTETPQNRTSVRQRKIILPQLMTSVISGAFVGGTIFKANKQSIFQGMLLGGASALAATVARIYLHKYINEHPNLKNKVASAFENAVALSSGIIHKR